MTHEHQASLVAIAAVALLAVASVLAQVAQQRSRPTSETLVGRSVAEPR